MKKEITVKEYEELDLTIKEAYRYNVKTKKYDLRSNEELNEMFWCEADSMNMGHKL